MLFLGQGCSSSLTRDIFDFQSSLQASGFICGLWSFSQNNTIIWLTVAKFGQNLCLLYVVWENEQDYWNIPTRYIFIFLGIVSSFLQRGFLFCSFLYYFFVLFFFFFLNFLIVQVLSPVLPWSPGPECTKRFDCRDGFSLLIHFEQLISNGR